MVLMQLMSAWAMTNLAAGTDAETEVVVAHDVIPLAVELLYHTGADVKAQAAWLLGNITGASTTLRDRVLHTGALPNLVSLLSTSYPKSVKETAMWTLANCCKNSPEYYLVRPALLPVATTLMTSVSQFPQHCHACH